LRQLEELSFDTIQMVNFNTSSKSYFQYHLSPIALKRWVITIEKRAWLKC